MARARTTVRSETRDKRDLVAEFDALRARVAERNEDLTDEELEELAELWANAVKAQIRDRIERGQPA